MGRINFLAASEQDNGTHASLTFLVRGADAVGATTIDLLDSSGNTLPANMSTCAYGGVCLLSVKFDHTLQYGVYQVLPQAQTLKVRVRYSNGSARYSTVTIDPSLSL